MGHRTRPGALRRRARPPAHRGWLPASAGCKTTIQTTSAVNRRRPARSRGEEIRRATGWIRTGRQRQSLAGMAALCLPRRADHASHDWARHPGALRPAESQALSGNHSTAESRNRKRQQYRIQKEARTTPPPQTGEAAKGDDVGAMKARVEGWNGGYAGSSGCKRAEIADLRLAGHQPDTVDVRLNTIDRASDYD